MNKSDNLPLFISLRQKHKEFTFESFDMQMSPENDIHISYHFHIDNLIHFRPTIHIPYRSFYIGNTQENKAILSHIAFHIGMIELISYWKCCCPEQIIIKPYQLSLEQINWWKNLYFHGLGEFLYLNNITTTPSNLIHIKSESTYQVPPITCTTNPKNLIIPIGGGKDSITTLSLLKDIYPSPFYLIMNPRGATIDTIQTAGKSVEEAIIIHRFLDKKLLELNAQGYLNGHTPFSALLGFITLFAAVLTQTKEIALSNEASANESTVKDTMVNHQYSKSIDFENDFRAYTQQYISPSLSYFSFLRPLSELQIAKLFAQQEAFHPIFRSCNVGSKTNIWCGHCSKCLFTYIMLSPFLSANKVEAIFHANLFNKTDLQPILDELCGISEVKPFECVGTIDEVNMALQLTINQRDKNQPLESLLAYYTTTNKGSLDITPLSDKELHQFHSTHHLSDQFLHLLKNKLDVK